MKSRSRSLSPWLGGATLALSACAAEPVKPLETFPVELRVRNELQQPLQGVEWSRGAKGIGSTDKDGILAIVVPGLVGDVVQMRATCPKGHRQEPILAKVRLKASRSLVDGREKALRFEAVCERELVDVVLVVQVEGASVVPIRVDGRPVGMTAETGSLHLLRSVPRNTKRVDVSFDTSELPRLRPANPSRTFELHERDTVLIFEQEFSLPHKKRQARRRKPPKRVPYRID